MSDVKIDFKVATAKARADLNKLDASVRSVGNRVTTAKLAFANMVSAAAINMISRSINLLSDSFMSMVDEAARVEQVTQSFNALTGSITTTEKVLKDLTDFASTTPFTIPGIQEAAKLLLATGTNTEDLIPLLRQLGDVSAVGSNDIIALSRAFSKIQGQGKVTAETFETLINQGPVLGEALAQAAGVDGIGALRKEMEKGKVTADIMRDALVIAGSEGGKAFGGMEKQSKTFSGRLSNLKDTMTVLAGEIGTMLLPALTRATKALSEFIQRHSDAIKDFARESLIEPLIGFLDRMSKALQNMTKEEVADFFREITSGLRDFTTVLSYVTKLMGKIPPEFAILTIALSVAKTAVSVINVAWIALSGTITFLITNFTGIITVAKILGRTLIGMLLPALTTIGTWFSTALATIVEYSAALSGLAGFAAAAAAVIGSIFYSPGAGKGADDISAYMDAVEATEIPLRKFSSAQQEANDKLAEELGIFKELDILMAGGKIVGPIEGMGIEPKADTDKVTPKRESNDKLTEEQRRFNAEMAEIQAEQDLADEEHRIYKDETQVAILDDKFDKEANYLERERNAKQKAIENTVKDEKKKKKLLAKLDADYAKKKLAAQRSADMQLVQVKRQSDQLLISGAFGLASTLGGIAAKNAKQAFYIQQALAIGQATVAAYTASNLALATPPGPPYTVPLAAATFAKGMINVGLIAATTFVQGSFGKFANGGIVGGNSYTGDNVPVYVNSKEMILNDGQQANLFKMANGGGNNNSDMLAAINGLGERISSMEIVVKADDHEIARSVRRAQDDGFNLA